MESTFLYFLFVVGLVFIIKGGDWFVDAASFFARVTGIPQFVIGATIVSVATTLPELFVSALASSRGQVDLAIGNSLGSVMANQGLILALVIIFLSAHTEQKSLGFRALLMMGCAAILLLFSFNGKLAIPGVLFLVSFLALFLWDNLRCARQAMAPTDVVGRRRPENKQMLLQGAKFALGAAGIAVGARLLVDNGVKIAEKWGIPSALVGVTLIAIGTSLPELVTAITAIVKKEAGLSVGNIIGANILNMGMVLPVCTLISGKELTVSSQAFNLDLPFCLAICAITVIPVLVIGSFRRWQGWLLLVTYAGYLSLACFSAVG